MERQVVITGLSIITPIGIGENDFWDALISGRSGVDYVKSFDASSLPAKIAGEVVDFNAKDFIKQRKALKVMARDIQIATAAANAAMEDADLTTDKTDPARVGVSLGAGLITTELNELGPTIAESVTGQDGFDIKRFGGEGIQQLFPLWLLKYLPNMLACHISIFHDAQGPNNTITTGGAASAQAIGEAYRVILRDAADVIICGGSDAKVNPLSMLRYSLLNILSTRNGEPEKACRPFDKDRDGMVVGEGAGIIILEELSHALKRNAKIYAELIGYGTSCDAQKGIIHSDGKGRSLCMKNALKDAGINPEDVDYLNASASGIIEYDRAEAAAIREVFGHATASEKIAVSSTKSMTGDVGAGSGSIGLITSILSICNSAMPPSINYENADPECQLDCIISEPREAQVNVAMNNASSLCGQNATLVMKKY